VNTLKRISVLLALGACLAAAGCGSDDEGGKQIPADIAQALEAQLTSVERRLDNGTPGACKDILEGPRGPDRESVQQLLAQLPDDVDPDVRDALEQSFENLWSLVESRCQELENEQPAQTETAEPEPEPEPTPTETTETIPPPETETVPPDEEELAPDGDGESGGAIPEGEGEGNGGGGIGPGAFKEKKDKDE
jgi:hypothetical protein